VKTVFSQKQGDGIGELLGLGVGGGDQEHGLSTGAQLEGQQVGQGSGPDSPKGRGFPGGLDFPQDFPGIALGKKRLDGGRRFGQALNNG